MPILVESPPALFTEMLRPDGLEAFGTLGSINVANESNADHWRSFNNCHPFNYLLFVDFGSRFVCHTNNMRHARFVAEEGCKMNRLVSIILWESLYSWAVAT